MLLAACAREVCWETDGGSPNGGQRLLGSGTERKHWHWQGTAQVRRNRRQGARLLLGPMAETAPEDTGPGVRAAPQDASVSAGRHLSPGGWGGIGALFPASGSSVLPEPQDPGAAGLISWAWKGWGGAGPNGGGWSLRLLVGASEVTSRPEVWAYREMMFSLATWAAPAFPRETPPQECAHTHQDS